MAVEEGQSRMGSRRGVEEGDRGEGRGGVEEGSCEVGVCYLVLVEV